MRLGLGFWLCEGERERECVSDEVSCFGWLF